ncbi:hypothetical protein [Phreatobacter sp.]|uniref:hypothetical protein n=1 Tax=Phreatobacter sp. TaxID=1966341 RepID=UPI003F6FDEA7
MVRRDAAMIDRRAMLTASVAFLLVVPGRAPAQGLPGSSGSLAYDRLDLSSPDAALRAFLTAYRDGDFVTAFWIFTPETQDEIARHVATLNLHRLAALPTQNRLAILAEMLPPTADLDQRDLGFMFANIMQVAQRRGMQPLNLTGLPQDLSPANVPDLGRRTETTDGATEVAVTLSAYRGPVVFRLVKARTGRWRLRQVVPPGSDPESTPFGLPAR